MLEQKKQPDRKVTIRVDMCELQKHFARIATGGIMLNHAGAIEAAKKCLKKFEGVERIDFTDSDASEFIQNGFN